jgi:hypothetical protein
MVKRAPDNVRYLGQFGEDILPRSFTARDPKRPFHDNCTETEIRLPRDAAAPWMSKGTDRHGRLKSRNPVRLTGLCSPATLTSLSLCST